MKNGFISDEEIYNIGLAKQDSTEPTIKSLPNPVIISDSNVVTTIEDTYVVYGMLGGTTEYLAFGESFSSIENMVNYVIGNSKYETVDITINANGNNGRTDTLTQSVQFINDSTTPVVSNLPSKIIICDSEPIIEIEDNYVTFGTTGGIEKYMIEGITGEFETMKEIVKFAEEWLAQNNLNEVTANIVVNASGNNGKTVTSTQSVQFINDDSVPTIGTLPTPIITNVTSVASSYVTYGAAGGTEEYIIVGVDETFTTMIDLVAYADDWLTQYSQYEVEVGIKITAVGNNKKTAESTQTVKFIRGVNVTNETELNTALASTAPLYINVVNDIACSNTISVDGVTHKLDLNNCTVSKTVTDESFTFITLGSSTNLTILDSSSSKQGNILANLYEETNSDGDNRETDITCIKNNGVLTIESGTVSANSVQKMLAANNSTNVDNSCTAINNTGTVNLNGGTVYSNIITQGCSYMVVWSSIANARGIENTGTVNLNSGAITTNADAYMARPSGATVWGETYAYSYGIKNSGTVNQNGSVTFTTTVEAHSGGTFTRDSDSADIK